jgi:hypothetical protein
LAARRGGSAPDLYSVPSNQERIDFRALVRSLIAASQDRASLSEQARSLGYQLEELPELPGVRLLSEIPSQRRGGGAYLFRAGVTSRLIVQAPHTFSDEGTLPLACEFFRRASAVALFIDTAHRYKSAEVDEQGDYPADVAHAPESLFQAATAGALDALGAVTVLQLHGFAPRESGAAVVVSSGTKESAAPLPTRARDLLSKVVTGKVLRFPDESQELGATTNVQGAIVRAAGGRFLHLEMSAELRQALLADQAFLGRYMDALERSLALP